MADTQAQKLPFDLSGTGYLPYPASAQKLADGWVLMARKNGADVLLACGAKAAEYAGDEVTLAGQAFTAAPLNNANAQVLRRHFAFTAPSPVLRQTRSFGLGDRLGIAAPGHLLAMEQYDAYPVLAQQSMRELNLTDRTYADVLDAASYGVFRAGYTRGFGADGDHLKTADEVEYALGLGYTMITLDCSEHIRGDVNAMDAAAVSAACTLTDEVKGRYLGKSFDVGAGEALVFDEEALARCVLIYGKAVEFAAGIFASHIADKTDRVDFEISIDETETPTTPLQHYFVAAELLVRGVEITTVAPRFCGEFQKGVDYIGNVAQFDAEMAVHAAIAEHFGYKLSIHSGSDKFSVFRSIGKLTRGHFHVKTAGTSWLVAMQVVAEADPALYRQVHKFALARFDDARKFYHVTTNIAGIPDVDTLPDAELPGLFTQNDARQLIHITYGFILTEKGPDGKPLFRERLYELWNREAELYALRLKEHIGHHLELLYQGCDEA